MPTKGKAVSSRAALLVNRARKIWSNDGKNEEKRKPVLGYGTFLQEGM